MLRIEERRWPADKLMPEPFQFPVKTFIIYGPIKGGFNFFYGPEEDLRYITPPVGTKIYL
jgi:hypothetical protein